jgi:hypothetical protein
MELAREAFSTDHPRSTMERYDKMDLDRALELAVVASWDDLVNLGESCSIHVEYTNMSELPLNSVEVWEIKNRGNGTLVCRYTISRTDSSPVTPETLEMRFANNYRSMILANNLDFIMRNQQQFSRHPDRSIHGLVQIDLPSEEERKSAAIWSRGICADATKALAVEVLQGKPPIPDSLEILLTESPTGRKTEILSRRFE